MTVEPWPGVRNVGHAPKSVLWEVRGGLENYIELDLLLSLRGNVDMLPESIPTLSRM